jgi:hypothetical protein
MRTPTALLLLTLPAAAQDLAMEKVITPKWPNGLAIHGTGGVCWADFDGDGWVDFFGAREKQMWRNRGGVEWDLSILPDIPVLYRYGSAAGDYNNDGLPDLTTEPRKITNERMKLLRNDGDFEFTEVGSIPGIIDLQPWGDSETNTFCDVDFDGNLDLFVPTYGQEQAGMYGPGNFFLHNQGPTGPGGEYRFFEVSAQVGLDEVPGTSRCEGTEWCDVDQDGDPDVFVGGTLFQNNSLYGSPFFHDVSDSSGIEARDQFDEGLFFFDMDLDGDPDLFVLYCQPTEPRVYENFGDGTFALRPKSWFEAAPNSCIDVSNVDFDNDGDIDLTLDDLFLKNQFIETGQRRWTLASHNIPSNDLPYTTFAWADWNRDGDQDLLMGPWGPPGHLYENSLYGPDTPPEDKRHVRVRVVRDSETVERGLETEFGATVELYLHDEPGRLRRRKTVTSSAGYLNQNEYTVQFALPPSSSPGDGEDWTFDVTVDYPSDPSVGLRRVDRHVNPVLGGLDLADLTDREIWVYRSGRVRVNGCLYEPISGAEPVMTATTGGLALVTDQAGLPRPTSTPTTDWWVGVELDTSLASAPQRVREVIIDGLLSGTDLCTGEGVRLALWDVTNPAQAVLAGTERLARYLRNDRGHYRTNLVLMPGRTYRLLARVDSLRGTAIAGPVTDGPVTTHGGLSFQDATPCDDIEVLAASVDASQVYLSARFSEDSGSTWVDLGHALAGAAGPATLSGDGAADPGATLQLDLADALPSSLTLLVSSTRAVCLPMAGGVLVPAPDVLTPVVTDAGGAWTLPVDLPPGLDPGTTYYFQTWWVDGTAPGSRAGSNALSVTAPY